MLCKARKRRAGGCVFRFLLGDTRRLLDEVKRKLEEQIAFYVGEALQDKEYGNQLLGRRAPVTQWPEYYFIRFTKLKVILTYMWGLPSTRKKVLMSNGF